MEAGGNFDKEPTLFLEFSSFFELVFSHRHRIPKAGSQFWGGACVSSALVRLYGGLHPMVGAIQGWRDCITRLTARWCGSGQACAFKIPFGKLRGPTTTT